MLHPKGLRGYVLSANRLRVDAAALPAPDVSLYLVPERFGFRAGERVRFRATVTNHTETVQAITGRVDVDKPSGNPFGGNPVVGPVTKSLAPGQYPAGAGSGYASSEDRAARRALLHREHVDHQGAVAVAAVGDE